MQKRTLQLCANRDKTDDAMVKRIVYHPSPYQSKHKTRETMEMNEPNNTTVTELCSRKLWEMVSANADTTQEELQAAIAELEQRRHYLAELQQLGKSDPKA